MIRYINLTNRGFLKQYFFKKIKVTFKIFFIVVFLTLAVDFLFGKFLLSTFDKKSKPLPYVDHDIYDHTLKKNFKEKITWEDAIPYEYCTDKNGFRSKCTSQKEVSNKKFDIAFLGDSFTEGIGVEFSKTFVGLFEESYPNYNIANLAVTSYSPSVYLIKFKELLKEDYFFNRIFVFIDISDIHDEAKKYDIKNNKIVRKKNQHLINLQKKINQLFPIITKSNKRLKNVIIPSISKKFFPKNTKECNYLDKCYRKSSWTFEKNAYDPKYISKSILSMEKLHKIAKDNNISLSIGVYPWPAQLLYDGEKSRQVKIWRDFCETRCEFFFNSFPDFFNIANKTNTAHVLDNYFIKGDVHFNEKGHKIIAENLNHVIKKRGLK